MKNKFKIDPSLLACANHQARVMPTQLQSLISSKKLATKTFNFLRKWENNFTVSIL